METQIEALIYKLIECIDRSSHEPLYSKVAKHDIKKNLQSYLTLIKCRRNYSTNEIEALLAPTGCIQELAIENNWSDEYIKIAEEIDMIIKDNTQNDY